mmetsp:Transcript_36087/g.60822  ORF Transcript_36087/g.60822 Transcript_36087/m.60822 type:complete len:255 (-) Transcript_36087:13-777(-)
MGNSFTSSKKHSKGNLSCEQWARTETPGASKVTEVDRAILDLKVQKRKLTEYQKRVESSAQQAEARAKEYVASKNRARALTELRKKKYMDQTVQRVDDQLLRLEEMVLNIQQSVQTAQVVDRLKQGALALKEVQKGLRVEEVDALMDATSEAHSNLQQVNELLSQGLTAEDDVATEAELAMLESQMLESQMLEEELPAVPNHRRVPERRTLEEELPAVPKHKLQLNPESAASFEALRAKAGEGIIRQMEPALPA